VTGCFDSFSLSFFVILGFGGGLKRARISWSNKCLFQNENPLAEMKRKV
jgi:hypothetical protein